MENYEQKYKEALEMAKFIKKNADDEGTIYIGKFYLENIFPELKKSNGGTMSHYRKDLEDSRLLFRTFCDGLMYGMFFYHGENLYRVASIEGLEETVNGVYPIKKCKPCLRPMSSMTEEELNECVQQSGIGDIKCPNWHDLPKEKHFEARLNHSINMFLVDSRTIDWLNAHHFDYRGLIEMGLALEAPEGMYKS